MSSDDFKVIYVSGHFSVHNKKINLVINGEERDISNLFPHHKYSDKELLDPTINWKVRVKISKVIRKYLKSLDKDFPENIVVC